MTQLTSTTLVVIKPSSSCKTFIEMKANPRADWKIADIQRLCDQLGMELKKPTNGSHYKVVGRDGKPLTIPAHKPIKPVYIKALIGWAMEHCREADEGMTK